MGEAATLLKPRVGRPLYVQMRKDFDYAQIIWTIQRYNPEITRDRAESLLDAFLQWVSLVPLNRDGKFITMFQSPVEEAFHCFVLNTRLYASFCERFFGFFFHYDPLVEESGPEIEEAARFTLDTLESQFGDELHEELRQWRCDFDAGTYKVACAGPGGRCH